MAKSIIIIKFATVKIKVLLIMYDMFVGKKKSVQSVQSDVKIKSPMKNHVRTAKSFCSIFAHERNPKI